MEKLKAGFRGGQPRCRRTMGNLRGKKEMGMLHHGQRVNDEQEDDPRNPDIWIIEPTEILQQRTLLIFAQICFGNANSKLTWVGQVLDLSCTKSGRP